MKLFFILLMCIAVTNAAFSYSGYVFSYNYFCKQRFCVYPKPSSFCYNVYYKTSWCNYKYYAPVLKVYPGETCGTEGWAEKSVADVLSEMENALKESLLKITVQMDEKRIEWEKKLSENIDSYKATNDAYLTRYYEYLIQSAKNEIEKEKLHAERDKKIKVYEEKLDEMKNAAVQKYKDAMADKVKCIQDYHSKLLHSAKTCLEARLAKITEYSAAVDGKIDEYQQKFKEYLYAILDKKVKNYRSVLNYVHGEGFEEEKTDAVIRLYRTKEEGKIDKIVSEYVEKLGDYKSNLVKYYRCAYRCYLSTSCLQFYKKYYYNMCRSLGCWYRFKTNYCVQRYCIKKFSFPHRERKYSGLKTCETMPVKSVPEITEPLKKKLEARVAAAESKFSEWKAKWEKYHEEYVGVYKQIMTERHKWYIDYVTAHYVCLNNSEELNEEQKEKIAQLKTELAEKLKNALEQYKLQLEESRDDCVKKFDKSIDEYKTTISEMITKIGEKYQTCLDTRAEKIKEYRQKLFKTAINDKIKMLKEMVQKKVDWVGKVYMPMYEHFHEIKVADFSQEINDLIKAHVDQIVNDCNKILNKCVAEWLDVIPKLVQHYSCCYSCKASKLCIPTYCFGGYYQWTVKYPSACYYHYYYKVYRRCNSFRVRYVKNCYRYC